MSQSFHTGGRRPTAWAATLVVLAMIAAWVIVQTAGPRADARNLGPATGFDADGSMLAIAGQLSKDAYGLYLVDRRNRTICVYQWHGKTGKLRLVASRTYAFDLQLDEYNTEPLPSEIKQLVGQARRLHETSGQTPDEK